MHPGTAISGRLFRSAIDMTADNAACTVNNTVNNTVAHARRRYAPSRMLGATAVFASSCVRWLRGQRPSVLRLEAGPRVLHSEFVPPRSAGTGRVWPVHSFNPSIVLAPVGLCPRCAYVATVRADARHQCDDTTPFMHGSVGGHATLFRGTAVLVFDANFSRLGATWLVNAPEHQVADQSRRDGSIRFRSGWVNHSSPGSNGSTRTWFRTRRRVELGAADQFEPVFSRQVFDVRLFSFGGHLFASVVTPSAGTLNLLQLQLTGTPTEDGGISQLRAWSSARVQSDAAWAAGRNQALFSSPSGELMVQPWLGLVAAFGSPHFKRRLVRCGSWRWNARPGIVRAHLGLAESHVQARKQPRVGTRWQCGTHPGGQIIELDQLAVPQRWPLRLLFNHTLPHALATLGYAISGTVHLVPVVRHGASGPCRAFLGIGHTHRAAGIRTLCRNRRKDGTFVRAWPSRCKRVQRRRRFSLYPTSPQPFQFGYIYTHFFYTLEPRPPYRMLSTSSEWCLASNQDHADCESIQFVSGATMAEVTQQLVLAYGANDCESKVGVLLMKRVWSMLQPLSGQTDVCNYDT